MINFRTNIIFNKRVDLLPFRPNLLRLFYCLAGLLFSVGLLAQQKARTDILLNDNWQSVVNDQNIHAYDGFEKISFNSSKWKKVDVPHNWDQYEGYRRMQHGNRHGYAWYRRVLPAVKKENAKRYFLFFEGVGSYATVWLNGKKLGYHAGGRTTFTIDITDALISGTENLLAVRADHPAFITDLPWVCGGCSNERGFSEGSQPIGIFRPVHLIITGNVSVQPFGVHAWNDTNVLGKTAVISVVTNLKNYSNQDRSVVIYTEVDDPFGRGVTASVVKKEIGANEELSHEQQLTINGRMYLWSLTMPNLYRITTKIIESGKTIDSVLTTYGLRQIHWAIDKNGTKQFFLNGQPVFINGIAEYEHLLGGSHAFGNEEIKARARQIKSLGFNAFRDGHQPHNLLYQSIWDEMGILSWTQLSAHVWFDSPAFRNNFKQLLKEWVIERRNSPSVILWGLQNESKLPADFAKECTELIRSLDPTASSQRLVTTCNGGEGTDWDVPQNWTGTYGGDPATYAADIKKQILIGEYGAWRTIGLHTEGGYQSTDTLSEERMGSILETKIRLADSVKDSCAGQFLWLYNSHDNPGRVQGGEGLRELDRIGPVNYKGLLTSWGEPTDAFYLYQAAYSPGWKRPMVYIVSHTWPQRWTKPGIKNNIIVYSNCDKVELFNDINSSSLGIRTNKGRGTHFQWDSVDIKYNVLYAVGYVNGEVAAKDTIVLNYLPMAPHFNDLYKSEKQVTKPTPGYHYLYRVNCGGGGFKDSYNNQWLADIKNMSLVDAYSSSSWTDQFNMPAYFASQRQTTDPVKGTKDWSLFQTYRYGRDQLKFRFPLPDGKYLVELYFTEPWWGKGNNMDCSGFRVFDVAVNDHIVLHDLDIWKEAGSNTVLKKTVEVTVSNHQLVISFPHVKAGQAVISAIAIAGLKKQAGMLMPSDWIAERYIFPGETVWTHHSWMNTGDRVYPDKELQILSLPPNLYGAEWMTKKTDDGMQTSAVFEMMPRANVYVALPAAVEKPAWMEKFEDTKTMITTNDTLSFKVYRRKGTMGQRLYTDILNSPWMYLVAVTEATILEPAYDLKPVTTYKTTAAVLSPNILIKEAVNGKLQAVVNDEGAAKIEWSFLTGVADEYSITLKYNLPQNDAIECRMQLLSADNNLLKTETVKLTNTRPGKWNYFTITTGGMINAGNYKLQLNVEHAKGLAIGSVDIQ